MNVLVCRARPEAEQTARRLAEAGHHAVVAPVLDIVSLPVALPTTLPDAVLITSRNAATVLETCHAESLRACPVYAVGRSTAAAVRRAGFRDIRVAAGDAGAMLDLMALTLRAPSHLLYLAGRVRKPALSEALRARGHTVSILEVYDVQPSAPWDAAVRSALRSGAVAAALHYSRHSAELAIDAARQADVVTEFTALCHACISADTAVPLVDAGVTRVFVAGEPDETGLLEALRRGDTHTT